MTLGRADWFMPSFYHSVLLQLPLAVGPKGLRSCLTCATTACILRSRDQPGSAIDWSPNFNTGTRGFAAPEDARTAVCVLPGTELAFDKEFQCARIGLFGLKVKTIEHTTAIFRQINKSEPRTHHDALEFPDGHVPAQPSWRTWRVKQYCVSESVRHKLWVSGGAASVVGPHKIDRRSRNKVATGFLPLPVLSHPGQGARATGRDRTSHEKPLGG